MSGKPQQDNPLFKHALGAHLNPAKRMASDISRLSHGEPTYRHGSLVATDANWSRADVNLFGAGSRHIDLRKKGTQKITNLAPYVIDGGFTITPGVTSVVIAWTGMLIRIPDPSTPQTLRISDSSVTVTGLNAATPYYCLPFFSTLSFCKTVGFVTGTAGSPAIIFDTNTSSSASALQQRADRLPLSNGFMTFTTGAAPTTSGGSRRTYPDGCPRARVGLLVQSRTRGLIPVEDMHIGEHIASPHPKGWVKVAAHKLSPCEHFVKFTIDEGAWVEQSPETPQPLALGVEVPCRELQLRDRVLVRAGVEGSIRLLEDVYAPNAMRVMVTMEDIDGEVGDPRAHTFYCSAGSDQPAIAIHNILSKF
jgi:hypothetical protein